MLINQTRLDLVGNSMSMGVAMEDYLLLVGGGGGGGGVCGTVSFPH